MQLLHSAVLSDSKPSRKTLQVASTTSSRASVVRSVGIVKSASGLAAAMRRPVLRALKGRIFRSDLCGVSPLCGMNESYDPWDRRETLVMPVRLRAAR